MRTQKNSALLAEMEADSARKPSEDSLKMARAKVAEMRDLELANAQLAERQKQNAQRLKDLREKEIVDLFDRIGIDHLGLPADGNLPAYEIEIGAYYHANITEDTVEDVNKSYEWLRKQKHGDLIKATYTIEFGRGESGAQKKFEALLKKNKIQYSYKFGVPWNTLTAFVREQIEDKKATLPLKLLGATVGRVAKVVKQKKGK